MPQAGQRVCDFIRLLGALSLGLTLALGAPIWAQTSGGSAGGVAPQAPAVKVQADATQAPVSGGFAPQGGAKPKVAVSGGASGGALDYQGWARMAARAETALANAAIPDAGLETIRLELTRWRAQLLDAQSANSTRIATLKDQIAALGDVPADGATEDPEIATRRAELAAQMTRLQAPGLAADEAYRRADGLIREIDRVLRERQADALLKLWPNPLYPGNWRDAATALSATAKALWDETAQKAADPRARAKLADTLPLNIPLLAFALIALWRGRFWADRLAVRLRAPATARGQRILGFGTSLGQIIVPVLACAALGESLRLSAMLGPVGLQIAGALVPMGSAVFGAAWLGVRIFPATNSAGLLLDLPADRRAKGRDLTTAFGALLALDVLRRVAMAEVDVSDAATSVLSLPAILAGAYILVRLGRLMRQTPAAAGEQGSVTYRNRLLDLLARGVIAFGTLGPILAVLGYISAAAQLVFPTALTLGLVALLYLIQQLISEVYGLLMRTEEEQDTLVPVLLSFALALAMLPAVALIWGARVSDLTELWTRFTEGYQLGDTRISPTDFVLFAVIFGIGMSLTRLLQGALKSSILPRTSLDKGGQNAVVSVTGYVGIFVAALVAINSSGIDLSGIAIVAGALSVGIGFGLQTVVSNFVSGIILLIERPISEGDWIEVGPVQGIVSSISVRSTRIQTFDRSDVIVPNSDLISGRVTNWTRFSLTGRVIVAVSVPYTEDSRHVAKILREIAEAQPMVLLSPPPLVAFMGFAAEMMQFELRVILRDVNFQVEVRSEINHQIAARFRAEAIPFTSAHRDHLKRMADEHAAEAEDLAQEAANIAAVEAILATPMPGPMPAGKPK